MKKEYICPQMKVTIVKPCNILAGSLGSGGNGDGRPSQAKDDFFYLIGVDDSDENESDL